MKSHLNNSIIYTLIEKKLKIDVCALIKFTLTEYKPAIITR